MKERPILFSAPMVRAILDGSKTQTRRVVKPQPFHGDSYHDGDIQFAMWTPRGTYDPLYAEFSVGAVGGGGGKRDSARFPYGQPGDRLWVRETFYAFGRWETRFSPKKGRDEWHFIDMTLETGRTYLFIDPAAGKGKRSSITPTWWKRPAIHMPRRASRIDLDETSVRVERLQDISEADAIAEGIERHSEKLWKRGPLKGDQNIVDFTAFPRLAYRSIWEQINGPGSWEANPWVWCIDFQRIG